MRAYCDGAVLEGVTGEVIGRSAVAAPPAPRNVISNSYGAAPLTT